MTRTPGTLHEDRYTVLISCSVFFFEWGKF